MLIFFSKVILITSFISLGIILFSKISILAQLPNISFEGERKLKNVFLNFQKKFNKVFSLKEILKNVLLTFSNLIRKIEKKTFNMIETLYKEKKEKKVKDIKKDSYWEELRKTKEEK